jgi:hypothetical protein
MLELPYLLWLLELLPVFFTIQRAFIMHFSEKHEQNPGAGTMNMNQFENKEFFCC